MAERIIPERAEKQDKFKFAFIDNRLLNTPHVAASNIKKEIIRMSTFAKENIDLAVEMLLDGEKDHIETIRSNEEVINFNNKAITAFLTKIMGKDLTEEDDKKIGSYYHVVSDIERIGDYAENIMEYALRLRANELVFSVDAKAEIDQIKNYFDELYDTSIKAFDLRDLALLNEVDVLEQKIDDYSAELEHRHIERVKDGMCNAETGSIFLQTISNLERVGDHITNVAFSLKQYRHK